MEKLAALVIATAIATGVSTWAMGAETAQDTGAKLSYYPNEGGDAEVSVTPVISISAKPNVTFFTTGETPFTGALGINFSVL